jgi:hypothetical protein
MIDLALKTTTIGITICLAFLFIFSYYYFGAAPMEITTYLSAEMGAATGTQVSVPENPYNRLAQQLAEKEDNLEEREEALALMVQEQGQESESILNLIFVFMVGLFVMIASNFYLDFKARKSYA